MTLTPIKVVRAWSWGTHARSQHAATPAKAAKARAAKAISAGGDEGHLFGLLLGSVDSQRAELAQLGLLLFTKDDQTQRMCLTAMCNLLSGAPSAADSLLQVGGHMALVTQLSSPAADAQSQAAMAIGHMCRHPPALPE